MNELFLLGQSGTVILLGITIISILLVYLILLSRKLLQRHYQQELQLQNQAAQLLINQERLQQVIQHKETISQMLATEKAAQYQLRQEFDQHQINSLKLIQDSLQQASSTLQSQVSTALTQHGEFLGKRIDDLTVETKHRLKLITDEMNNQLAQGFEKTTTTFSNVLTRLTIIDEAQKRIGELSSTILSLQEILADKRSRGAWGEIQLNALLQNMLPENHFSLQHTLSNGKRVDCLLRLPPPSGNIAIDAKFPLESFQLLQNNQLTEAERKQLEKRFKLDIRHHIQSIAEKYIINEETADGAIMFIPAEAIFAEIHAHYPDLVDAAHQARVWLVSPTTLMAVLTTVRAVIKDAATRKQVNIIQEHLVALSRDFGLFQQRMDKLAQHINQAHQDVEQVHLSSKKISKRFARIENVEFAHDDVPLVM